MQAVPCGLQCHLLEGALGLHRLQKDPKEETAKSATLTSEREYSPARLCLKLPNLNWVMCSGYTVLNWTE